MHPFTASRDPCADNPDPLASFRIHHDQGSALARLSDDYTPAFFSGVCRIFNRHRQLIPEYQDGFLERRPVLLKIRSVFPGVLFEYKIH